MVESKQIVSNANKTNYMMLDTSHITNKYIDVSEYCDDDDDDDTDNTTNTAFHINELNTKQKLNVILDNVSLERVNSTKFLGVIIDET